MGIIPSCKQLSFVPKEFLPVAGFEPTTSRTSLKREGKRFSPGVQLKQFESLRSQLMNSERSFTFLVGAKSFSTFAFSTFKKRDSVSFELVLRLKAF